MTRCAVDGTTTQNVGTQLGRVPDHVTHIALSPGENDALENADLLGEVPVATTGGALDRLGERVADFAQSRRSDARAGGLRSTVSTTAAVGTDTDTDGPGASGGIGCATGGRTKAGAMMLFLGLLGLIRRRGA